MRDEAFRFASRQRGLAVDTQLVHRSALLRDFVTRGPQVALAIELLGPNVCFTHQQYIIKHPDAKARTDVPWHQDSGYGRLEPPLDLTVWIALDDCTLDNGCLWVLPHSERRGLQPHYGVGALRGVVVDETGVALPMRRRRRGAVRRPAAASFVAEPSPTPRASRCICVIAIRAW